MPAPTYASYAMYQASYDSYNDRKADKDWKPVATDDRASLAEIQRDIARKRPQNALKPQKAPQYCAGQTSSVSPMLENICANIGVSKADQSNTMTDDYGNMNLGVYNSLSGADAAKAAARQQAVREASEAARLRSLVKRQ